MHGIFQRRVSPSIDVNVQNVDPWKNKFHEVMKRNDYSGQIQSSLER
jgi:hypothetical protein